MQDTVNSSNILNYQHNTHCDAEYLFMIMSYQCEDSS